MKTSTDLSWNSRRLCNSHLILFLLAFIFVLPVTRSQTTGSMYFKGKPQFTITSVGKALTVDYQKKATETDDSIRTNAFVGMVDLATMVYKAMNDPTGEYKDYQVLDATKFGIIAFYHQEYTLFYCDVTNAVDLNNKKISFTEFIQLIQTVTVPDYVPTVTVQKKKTFLEVLKMDHAYYSFPMRLEILFPFGVSGGFDQGLGFELTNVWSRPKSVVNFKFQISFLWLQNEEPGIFERFIIPSFNMGMSFNFLGDCRFNLRPYVTLGWNPAYYYFKGDNDSIASPQGLNNTWYLNSGSLNYGLDLEGWIKKGLGISVSIEQSRYFAELIPDMYGSKSAVALDYFTFKVGLLF